MTNKPQFVGEKVGLGELLLDTFSGEWGMEEGESLTPVLRTSNFNEDGSLDYANPAMRCVPEKKVEKKRMVRGDIILEKSGGTPQRPVGIMAFYDSDALALCSNFNQVLRFREDRILSRFAFHQLRWLKDRNAFDRYTRKTTGLQNLQMKKLIELKLHVPQIEVQASVASTLDEIVSNQHALRQEAASLDSLVKSRFVEMFGELETNTKSWPVEKFDSFAVIDTHMISDLSNYAEEPHIGIDCIEAQTGRLRDYRTVSEDGVTSGKYLFTAKHIIYSKIRPNLNKVALPTFSGVCSADAYPILPVEDKCNRVFLAQVMRSNTFLDYILPLSGRAQMPKVNKQALRGFSTPLPPLALQQEFAAFVTQVDKSRFAYIWSRTKSVEQALSGPSLTLVIQHVEPQTRSKYKADVLASPS